MTSPAPLFVTRRYLALWFPFLPTDRAYRSRGVRQDNNPFVLVHKERGALRIAALDKVAARSGLRIGMALTEARALIPDMATAEVNLAADALLLRACAEACEIFTPLVALSGSDSLILDITGCAHLWGGEKATLEQARRKMAGIGLTSFAAMAGTPDAAQAFARHRRNRIAPPGEEEILARDLPITALDQSTETTLALSRAGFCTLGELADRPAHVLTARFGTGLVDQLNRIFGREDIRITPFRPPPNIVLETHFPEPLAQTQRILTALERLVRDMSALLERRGAGGRAFEASFFRADGAVRRLQIETGAPTRDLALLMRLLKLRIDALADPLDPGFGFDAIRLGVLRFEAIQERQDALDGKTGDVDDMQEVSTLVDRLVARFGHENVRRFVAQETHDPVRAGGTVPYLSQNPSACWPTPEPGQPPARPITLFEHPQLIEVMAEVPDSPPLRFRWRRVLHQVMLAEGPERIAPEWWRIGNNAPVTRDYYRVEDAQGHRFWIFREGLYEDTNARPRWFLHGLFA